jgi:glucose-6-phosphate 1-dehydrogenase
VIQFKSVPLCVLDKPNLCTQVEPNCLTVRIQPDEGIHLSISTKSPEREDRIRQASLDFHYSEFGMQMPEAYERVILDGLKGDPTLFWRADGIEAAWKAMEPLLETYDSQPAPAVYEPGSWGPPQAMELLRKEGRRWLSL